VCEFCSRLKLYVIYLEMTLFELLIRWNCGFLLDFREVSCDFVIEKDEWDA
jgi:hypothetical protein